MMDIAFAPVGNIGNANDETGYGSVGYAFSIGKFEITIGEYTQFLNAVLPQIPNASESYLSTLYSEKYMSNNSKFQDTIDRSGTGTDADPFVYTVSSQSTSDQPMPWVTWYSAARFVNWLNNGATSAASTETGAYNLNGATSGVFTHTAEAKFWLPTENEWYKAAYFDPLLNNGSGGYWNIPTGSNLYPDAVDPSGWTNAANYNDFRPKNSKLTDTGAYTFSPSSYGTYDQAGNLWEFLEASFQQNHIVRGGSWSYGYTPIESTTRRDYVADYLDDDTGFRIATAISPYVVVQKTTGFVPHYALTAYEQISALYLGILNREADGPGYQGWLSQLGAQTPDASLATWRAIADQIAASPEAANTYAALARPKEATQVEIEAFISGIYNSLLSRNPDPAGLTGWSLAFKDKAQTGQVGSLIVDIAAATYQIAAASDHGALAKNAALGIPDAYPLKLNVGILGLGDQAIDFI